MLKENEKENKKSDSVSFLEIIHGCQNCFCFLSNLKTTELKLSFVIKKRYVNIEIFPFSRDILRKPKKIQE